MDNFDPNTNQPSTEQPVNEPSDAEWTNIETPPASEAEAAFEETRTEHTTDQNEDWAEKSLDEVKAGLKQISDAIKYAFNEGKNDPKIKQFGEDVKSAFEKIGDDIEGIFKKD